MKVGLRPRWGLGLAATILLVLALVASCSGPGGPRVGAVAPDFMLPTLDGGTVTLSQLRGKPVFLNFWATWCPACREEMPHIQKLFLEQDTHGFVVLTVDLAESPATVKSFMEKEGYTLPVALDTAGRIGNLYNVPPLPTTYILDSQGVVRQVRVGAYPNKEAMLAQMKAIR